MSKELIKCPICSSDIENKCRNNGCGHEFCLQCLLRWTQTRIDCPVCRQTFTSIRHNFQSEENSFHTIYIKQIEAMIQLRDRLTETERRIEYFRQLMTEAEERSGRINEGIERICNISDNNENQVNEIIGSLLPDFDSSISTDSTSTSTFSIVTHWNGISDSTDASIQSSLDSITDSDTTVDSFVDNLQNNIESDSQRYSPNIGNDNIIIFEEQLDIESSLSVNSDENDSPLDVISDDLSVVINVLQSEKHKECIQMIENHLESCSESQSITSDMISTSDDNFIAENNIIANGNEDNIIISSDGSSFSSETSTLDSIQQNSEVLHSVDSYEMNSSTIELLDRMRTNNSEMLSSDDSSSH